MMMVMQHSKIDSLSARIQKDKLSYEEKINKLNIRSNSSVRNDTFLNYAI